MYARMSVSQAHLSVSERRYGEVSFRISLNSQRCFLILSTRGWYASILSCESVQSKGRQSVRGRDAPGGAGSQAAGGARSAGPAPSVSTDYHLPAALVSGCPCMHACKQTPCYISLLRACRSTVGCALRHTRGAVRATLAWRVNMRKGRSPVPRGAGSAVAACSQGPGPCRQHPALAD